MIKQIKVGGVNNNRRTPNFVEFSSQTLYISVKKNSIFEMTLFATNCVETPLDIGELYRTRHSEFGQKDPFTSSVGFSEQCWSSAPLLIRLCQICFNVRRFLLRMFLQLHR